jgi:thiaminase/transcriptional activator TenA
MKHLNRFWEASQNTYDAIIEHPFNQELAKGTLDEQKFSFYLSQDAVYIGEYSRALAALASKAPTHSILFEFISFAKEGLEIERELHDHYMKVFNVQKAEKIALSTESYANFLLSSVAYKSFEEALSGLLPCFWLYNEVASYIYKIAPSENKYQKWIETYSSAEFDQTTERLKIITEELADSSNSEMVRRMEQQFTRSAKYEWFFWDSAYKLNFW